MYIFIVNPAAGYGRAKRIFSKIKRSELFQQIKSKHYYTKYDGHAEEILQTIVRENLANIKTIIVVGGDGTLHEVVNALKDNRIPLAFIPGGSGNDFARGTSINGNPLEIFRQIITGNQTISYWPGNYTTDIKQQRQFVNSIGFGFDAEVARTANNSIYKKVFNLLHIGSLSYVIALIKVLFHFKPFDAKLEVDGEIREVKQCWMITIANHPFYGGGMKIIPGAIIRPNRFPLLLIHDISKWKVLGLFLTVFTGKHITFKEVELLEAENVRIISESKLCYQVDGETNRCKSAFISKESRAIQVVGAKAGKEWNRMAKPEGHDLDVS